MALANTSDYAAVVNGLLYAIKHQHGGINPYTLPGLAQIDPVDFKALLATFATYEKARQNVPADSTLGDGSGPNKSTFSSGGKEFQV